MKRVIIIIPLIALLWSAQGQNLRYEYIRNDNRIGSLEVSNSVVDSIETFSIVNLVEFKIIFTFSVEYKMSESFENGVLVSGEGLNTLNGATQKHTKIRLKEDGYHLKIDGVEARNETEPIEESMSRIYHEELYDGKKVYSQYFGRYLTAEKIGEHKYSLKSPDGENIYKYAHGYCMEVKVIRDFATFYIKMLPESLDMVRSK
ncbi:MAG: hypothetical protein JXR03_12095 [Cyclobacteriaceae bacterium]